MSLLLPTHPPRNLELLEWLHLQPCGTDLGCDDAMDYIF